MWIWVAAFAAAGLAHGQDSFRADRVVAVGDVHGGYDEFVDVLRMAGVIGESNAWSGGKTHLVQTGDVVDRGPDSRKALELLMSLEKEAKKAGGQVHALIGNHEAMNVYGDLRYVSPAEYEAFRTPKSEKALQDAYKRSLPEGTKASDEGLTKWLSTRPPGWTEHREAFSVEGKYGAWILRHNAVIKVGDSLFLHGGIGPKFVTASIRDLNDRVRQELKDPAKLNGGIVTDPDGPLWYRGLAQEQEEKLAAHVDEALAHFKVGRIVVGHTVEKTGVKARFGGKVITIDVGLSKVYGGPRACLVIEGGKAFALESGQRKDLP